MTSAARIEANRRNALRSTGPRTEEGKERARLNALKHGLEAQTVVLPHEDAAAYEQRRAAWTRELSPGGEAGRYLAERATRLSWQLDRADAAERAELARRVRELPKERERSRRRRAAEQVRILLALDSQEPEAKPGRSRADRLERLESTAHGCRALLEAWANLDGSCAEAMVRLLGAAGLTDAARSPDPRLRRIAAIAAEARERSLLALVASIDSEPDDDEPKPRDDDSRKALGEIIAAEQERLMDLLEAHEAEVPDPAAEDAAIAAFDGSKEAEELHRYQNQWGRALLQTLKALATMRPAVAVEEPAEDEADEVSENTAATAEDEPAAAPKRSQGDEDNTEPVRDLRLVQRPRSRRRAAPRPDRRLKGNRVGQATAPGAASRLTKPSSGPAGHLLPGGEGLPRRQLASRLPAARCLLPARA